MLCGSAKLPNAIRTHCLIQKHPCDGDPCLSTSQAGEAIGVELVVPVVAKKQAAEEGREAC